MLRQARLWAWKSRTGCRIPRFDEITKDDGSQNLLERRSRSDLQQGCHEGFRKNPKAKYDQDCARSGFGWLSSDSPHAAHQSKDRWHLDFWLRLSSLWTAIRAFTSSQTRVLTALEQRDRQPAWWSSFLLCRRCVHWHRSFAGLLPLSPLLLLVD